MTVEFRPAEPDDARAATRLLTMNFPHLPVTARQVRERIVEGAEHSTSRHIAGFDGERLVAWQRVSVDRRAGSALAIIVVEQDMRRQGLGRTMMRDAEEFARSSKVRVVNAPAVENRGLRALASKTGWSPMHWAHYQSLDLRPLADMGAPRPLQGTEIVPGWRIEDPAQVYPVYYECVADNPIEEERTAQLPYETWLNTVWRGTGYHDSTESSLVLASGHPVSFAMFDMDTRSGRLWSTMTGTRRGWRGQSLATLAKAAMLQRAAERGVHTAWTMEHVGNSAINSINAKLGFVHSLTQVTLVKHLTDN